MEKNEIKLAEGTEQITVLEGDAVVVQNPTSIQIKNGVIEAAAQFLDSKEDSYEPTNAHIRVDKEAGTIELHLNEKDNNGKFDLIDCSLKLHPLASKLGINETKRFGRQELIDSIRQNRVYFSNKMQAQDIIKALRDFSGKVEKRFEIADDQKGNTKNKLETIVSEVPFTNSVYKLFLPIYQGQQKKELDVEICVDSSQGNLQFYLQSDDLYEIIIEYKEELINTALENLQPFGCSIIEVY